MPTVTITPKPGTADYEEQLREWGQDERPQQYAGIIICMAAATVAVAVRLYSQRIYNKLGWDDVCIVIALLIVYAQSIASFESLIHGAGLHQLRVLSEDLNPPWGLQQLYLAYWIVSVLWAPGVMFVKLSILIVYHRIFYVQQRWFKIALWINGVYAVALGIAATFIFIFQCLPVDYYWTRFVAYYGYPLPHGTCLPQLAHLVTPQILSTFSDLVILVLPIPIIVKLHMHQTRKIAILFVFLLGAFTVGCGLARIAVIFHVSNSVDVTWNNIDTVTFTVVECGVGIVCACLPASTPFYMVLLKRIGLISSSAAQTPPQRSMFTRRRTPKAPGDSLEDLEFQTLGSTHSPEIVPPQSKGSMVREGEDFE